MSTPIAIPFAAPHLEAHELRQELLDAVTRVIDSAAYINGPSVTAFEAGMARFVGVGHAVGVGNGTDALTIALLAAGVGAGDEVITALNITADGVTFRIEKTSNIKAKANCIFVSVWDGGTEVRSKAHYDPSTGEVTVLESHDAEVGLLDREFIEFGEDTLPVCKECHESVRQPHTGEH